MNLHVRTNSKGTLMFNIPRKVTAEFSISRILMDTYDLTEQYQNHTTFEVLPADPMVYAVILQHGLSVNDTTYNPITPTPPKFQTYKVNFRRIPQHYKPTDIIQLFSKYGNPKEIGHRKVYTQDGYVLFEKDEKPSHPELPKEIVAGLGAGFRQQRKRNSKKRRKNTQISSSMKGIESTSLAAITAPVNPATPVTPTLQESTQEARPPQTRNGTSSVTNPNNGSYRSLDDDNSDSDDDIFSDAPQTPTTEFTSRHPRAVHFGGTYNTSELSRQSATRPN
ncbi:hypothetical protein KI688_003204 [Linnemannia hyalina]|uniref:Uncharacterized protein n=1 Tax=Linnemannia hyalina TaxID=64524 RepID=A0A9P7XQP8_9FUNG|nr:hypothetical protein KI688_003204 [Linnemannia hyalina]